MNVLLRLTRLTLLLPLAGTAAVVWAWVPAGRAGETASAPVAAMAPASKAASNAAASSSDVPPAEVVIPRSVFVEPAEPQDGRDPFFPNSTRLFASPSSGAKQGVTPAWFMEVRLKGISGIPAHRLAIINGKTLAAGEETMLKTGARWLRMRCVEVKAESAIVEIGTERRELRLRSGN